MPYPPGAWRVYFPDDGQTAADAEQVLPATRSHLYSAEDVAKLALENDWDNSAGERGLEQPIRIVVVAPDGVETHWVGENSTMVIHTVEQVDTDTAVT